MGGRRHSVRRHVRLWSKGEPRTFWEIEQNDAVLIKRFGKVGMAGRTTQKACRDSFFASVELDRTVAEQIEKGFSRKAPARNARAATKDQDRAQEILDELDRAHAAGELPDLESFEWIVVGGRMHLFADPVRGEWGIAIEEITYGQSARRVADVLMRLHRFGNAFVQSGPKWLRPFDTEGVFVERLIGPDESCVCLAEGARTMRAWKKDVPLSHDRADYARARVKRRWPGLITKAECLALLARTQRDALFAPEAEVRRWAARGVKHLHQLDAWRHPTDAPSECPTFRRIARTLVRG